MRWFLSTNLGHVTTAYLGYLFNPEFIYLYEVLANKKLHAEVRNTMLQAADILLKKYPTEFSKSALTNHIEELLYRFQNKELGDTIFRVGCGLMRKLATVDRLSGAIRLAFELKMPYDKIVYALVCGCHFRAKDESGHILKKDVEFINHCKNSVKWILREVSGFNEIENKQLFSEVEAIDKKLKHISFYGFLH